MWPGTLFTLPAGNHQRQPSKPRLLESKQLSALMTEGYSPCAYDLWLPSREWGMIPDHCSCMLARLTRPSLRWKWEQKVSIWKRPTCCAAEDVWRGRAVGNEGCRVSGCRSIKGQCTSSGELTWWGHCDWVNAEATVRNLSLWVQSSEPVPVL